MLEQLRRSPAPSGGRRPSLGETRLGKSAFLSDAERDALEDAMLSSRTVRSGAELVREGDRTDRLTLLVRGWACRFKTTPDGGRQIVALLVPGDVVNLDALLIDRPGYGVRALTEATLASIGRQRALALAARHPGVARTFTWLALVENATLSQWALGLGRYSALQRLAHLFCELSVRLADRPERNGGFEFPLTQEHLGEALGLTPVHVNRTIQRLRADGLIATNGRSFTIPDPDALVRLGGFDPAYLHREPEDAVLAEANAAG